MFVGWIPESPEIPLYVFFIGDSANSLPHWALQAVGPAEQGKKDEHGRKLVNMNQIMGRIDNKQCWARGLKARMTERATGQYNDRQDKKSSDFLSPTERISPTRGDSRGSR